MNGLVHHSICPARKPGEIGGEREREREKPHRKRCEPTRNIRACRRIWSQLRQQTPTTPPSPTPTPTPTHTSKRSNRLLWPENTTTHKVIASSERASTAQHASVHTLDRVVGQHRRSWWDRPVSTLVADRCAVPAESSWAHRWRTLASHDAWGVSSSFRECFPVWWKSNACELIAQTGEH
jgi:hypothetical protein